MEVHFILRSRHFRKRIDATPIHAGKYGAAGISASCCGLFHPKRAEMLLSKLTGREQREKVDTGEGMGGINGQ
jgi:hypothetical protein